MSTRHFKSCSVVTEEMFPRKYRTDEATIGYDGIVKTLFEGTPMTESHIFDRYTEAALAAKGSKARAELLVQKLRDAAVKLKDWTDLQFVDGTQNKAQGFDIGRQTFYWQDVPEIQQVAKAAMEYQTAAKSVEELANEMTDIQREVLNLAARKV
jgi:hypothetical protein